MTKIFSFDERNRMSTQNGVPCDRRTRHAAAYDQNIKRLILKPLQLAFHGLPTEEVTAMLSGNAARVYGFDVAALTPLAQKYGPRVEVVAQPLAAIPEGVTSPAFFRK